MINNKKANRKNKRIRILMKKMKKNRLKIIIMTKTVNCMKTNNT